MKKQQRTVSPITDKWTSETKRMLSNYVESVLSNKQDTKTWAELSRRGVNVSTQEIRTLKLQSDAAWKQQQPTYEQFRESSFQRLKQISPRATRRGSYVPHSTYTSQRSANYAKYQSGVAGVIADKLATKFRW